MQSSLLRFIQGREKKKRSANEDDGNLRKRQKISGGSCDKLKKFNRHSSAVVEISSPDVVKSEPHCSNSSPSVTGSPSANLTTFNSVSTEEKISQELPVTTRIERSIPLIKPSLITASRGSGRAKSKTDAHSKTTSHSATLSKQYTPLEQQYIAIKSQYPDAILFVECGYKYRFFGEDAEVASKTLNIGCFQDHNFHTASIPVHRLHIHLRRLVAAGYKVGVVKQTETAALKAVSEKKSGPFSRELTALYTRTTLLGPDVKPPSERGGDKGEGAGGRGGGGWEDVEEQEEGLWMMCICELEQGTDKEKRKSKTSEITIGFLAIQPAVGNMVYEQFSDSVSSLSELQLRLSHLQPAEILYPHSCSTILEGALIHWKRYGGQPGVRTEKLSDEWFDYNSALSTVTDFYGREDSTSTSMTAPSSLDDDCSIEDNKTEALKKITDLPMCSLSCLGALIHHLSVFKLHQVLKLTSNLEQFSIGSHCMRLNSKTLENLEVFQNMENKKEKNTLFSILNHTRTSFGRRLLHQWTAHPLRKVAELQKRQKAVRELSSSESPSISLLKSLVIKLPDLEKMLCSAYHKKCSPLEFCFLMNHLSGICDQLESISDTALSDLTSELLLCIVKEVPRYLRGCKGLLVALNESAARDGCYEELFTDIESYPAVLAEKKSIAKVQKRLQEHRKQFRKTLGYPSAEYTTVSGVQYLVEVKNKDINKVPSNWTRISGTKQVTRFHPPYVLEDVQLLAQHSDQLVINAKQAWNEFLSDFSIQYGPCKKAVDLLATLDCLLSLAEVAVMPGYVCPTVVEEAVVEIDSGRHPVIDLLLAEGEQYVANNTHLNSSHLRAMIITGPNMGGKSSYIKQVALICIMGQIGSFVPAKSATLGMLDAVYTRMGASDHLFAGKSTFMVELTEASEIMRLATPHSLVILDELGRGTSTYDGVAVAYATLTHFVEEVKALTLFVTHYPVLAEMENTHPGTVGNFHMAYVEAETANEGYEKIVFLYQLERGQAGKSYGLNVAALAGLDSGILKLAAQKSRELESQCCSTSVSDRQQREEAVKTIVSLVQQQQQHQQPSLDLEAVIHIAKQVS